MKFRIRDYKTKSRKVYRDDHSQKIFERRVRCLLLIPLVISFLWCLITDAHKKYEAKSETVQETPAVEDSEPPSIEPVETPAEVQREMTIDEYVDGIIYKYFPDDYQTARAVFMAENCYYQEPVGWKPLQVGDENTAHISVGIAQIRMLPERNLNFDWLVQPENNISYARTLYNKSGWKPWSAYNNGSYIKYLGK